MVERAEVRAILHINEKWSVEYHPALNDAPGRVLRYGEPTFGGSSDWKNDTRAMFYALLERDARIAALEAQLAARTGGVKPLDLSNLLRHAFFEGFMIAGGSQDAVSQWWTEYDPETCPAYSRILSALSPAPEARQEPAILRAKNAGRYLAELNDGRLLYLNHANEWQECPNFLTHPSEQAVTEAMVEAGAKAIVACRFEDESEPVSDYDLELSRAALKAAMEAGR